MSTRSANRLQRGTHRRAFAPSERGSGWYRLLLAIIVVLSSVLVGVLHSPAVSSPTVEIDATSRPHAPARVSTIAPPPTPIHATLKQATATPQPPPKPALAPPIELSAKAAYAVDLTNGTPLYAVNADTPLPPASTTKIVTSLVVVRQAALDATVTIEADDTVDPTIYSHMGLLAGDVVTVRDLLAGMLLNSGGDAALALARFVGASFPDSTEEAPRQRFIDEMNREAARLGMKNTHFVNPDGRDTDGHVSTAHDLALAAQALFQHPVLERLIGESTRDVDVQGPNARTITLYNTNELLGGPGVHGVKTGTTEGAGECLVLATWENGARVITVLLGSGDRYADAKALLGYLNEQFRWVRLGRNGDLAALNDELAQNGYSLGIVRTVLLTAQQAAELTYKLERHPASGGGPFQAQGDVVFFIGAQPILRLAVYAGDPFNGGG